jgi:hypothetical protein
MTSIMTTDHSGLRHGCLTTSKPQARNRHSEAASPDSSLGLAGSLRRGCCLAGEQGPEERERNWRSRECLLQGEGRRWACIIGARLAWTVEMISSVLIPSR